MAMTTLTFSQLNFAKNLSNMLICESSDLEGSGGDFIDEKGDKQIAARNNIFTSTNLIDQRLISLASIMSYREKEEGEEP